MDVCKIAWAVTSGRLKVGTVLECWKVGWVETGWVEKQSHFSVIFFESGFKVICVGLVSRFTVLVENGPRKLDR